jgi:hypothetical protein
MGNPGDVAILLVVPLLLAVHRAIGDRPRRLLWTGMAMLMATVVAGSLTLTALAALAVGGTLIAWREVPGRRRSVAALAVAAISVAAAFTLPGVRQRITIGVSEARNMGMRWIGSGRGAGLEAALAMVRARPLFGVGLGQFEAHAFTVQDSDTLADRAWVLHLETGFGDAHNDVAQFAAETGIVGVLLTGGGLGWALRRSRGSGALPAIAPCVSAAAVIALTQFPLHLAAVAAQWAVAAALAVPPLPPSRPQRRRSVRAVVWLGAGLLAGIGSVAAWQVRMADIAVRQAKLLSMGLRASHAPVAQRREVARTATAGLASRLGWQRYSWDAWVALGNLAVDGGQTPLALDAFQRALELAERPEIHFNLGTTLLHAGDRTGAMEHFVRAVHLNPWILHEVTDAGLAAELKTRLDAEGYAARYRWIYDGTLAR